MKHVITRVTPQGITERIVFRISGYSVQQPHDVLYAGVLDGAPSITITGEVYSVTTTAEPEPKKKTKKRKAR